VLTGILSHSVRYRVRAPAVSEITPSKEVNFVILVPIVLIILHPPDIVPMEIAAKQAKATQSGS